MSKLSTKFEIDINTLNVCCEIDINTVIVCLSLAGSLKSIKTP